MGSPAAQDQKSLAKGVELEPAPALVPEGTPPPDPAAAPGGGMGGMPGMPGKGGMAGTSNEVYSLKSDANLPYKVLPIEMTVLVEQSRISEFLIGLENSPMAIQVMEPEITKPTVLVAKPVYGETNFGMGGMGGMGKMGGMGYGPQGGPGMAEMMGRAGQMNRQRSGGGAPQPGEGPSMGGMMGAMGRGFGAANTPKKTGIDLRGGVNKAEERKKAAKDAAKVKAVPKKNVDQYFNIVQVTVYGQARFYNTPAPTPPAEPSTPPSTDPAATPVVPAASAAPATPADANVPAATTPVPTQPAAPAAASSPVPSTPPTPPTGSEPASKTEDPKPDPAAPKTDPSAPKS